MPLLKDKVAFVTGAAAGIGFGVAQLFTEEGARVYVLDRDGDGAAAAAQRLGGHGRTCDVTKRADIQAAVDDAMSRYGRIDILVNNAGIYPRQDFLTMTEQQWDQMQDVNLKGVFHGCQSVLPQMIRQRHGRIVNISSVTFLIGFPRLVHYVTTKGGVIGFTRSLAREVGPHNVQVNCIAPGAIETEGEKLHADPAIIAETVKQQCLQRRITPLDVARVALFLSSDLSSGMTGQMLTVDGGLAMW